MHLLHRHELTFAEVQAKVNGAVRPAPDAPHLLEILDMSRSSMPADVLTLLLKPFRPSQADLYLCKRRMYWSVRVRPAELRSASQAIAVERGVVVR